MFREDWLKYVTVAVLTETLTDGLKRQLIIFSSLLRHTIVHKVLTLTAKKRDQRGLQNSDKNKVVEIKVKHKLVEIKVKLEAN